MKQSTFKFEAEKPAKRTRKKSEVASQKDEKKKAPSKKLEDSRKVKESAKKPDSITAEAVEARRLARMEKRFQRKAEQEDLSRSLLQPRDFSEDDWKLDDTSFNTDQGWIVVLTPSGDIYQEPVTRYCSFPVFLAIVCSLPEIHEGSRLRVEAEIVKTPLAKTPFIYGEITTALFTGTSKRNNFASYFNLDSEPKLAGGNIVFSNKDNTSFTKEEARKVAEWVIQQISKEEAIDIS